MGLAARRRPDSHGRQADRGEGAAWGVGGSGGGAAPCTPQCPPQQWGNGGGVAHWVHRGGGTARGEPWCPHPHGCATGDVLPWECAKEGGPQWSLWGALLPTLSAPAL